VRIDTHNQPKGRREVNPIDRHARITSLFNELHAALVEEAELLTATNRPTSSHMTEVSDRIDAAHHDYEELTLRKVLP
jgi:hypothetical protein